MRTQREGIGSTWEGGTEIDQAPRIAPLEHASQYKCELFVFIDVDQNAVP
jgi:hypothetical protein